MTEARITQRFTLVEMMIVVLVLGLILAIAVPSFSKARKRAQNTRFVNDLRIATGAFEVAIMEIGFPPDRNPAQMPVGMAPYLDNFPWTEETPIGGKWDWDYGVFDYTAGVSVYQPAVSAARMQTIDDMFDDGDLGKGKFRSRSAGYIRIIEH